MAYVPPLPPLALFFMPPGCYGISYDIRTNATELDLPNGWNSHRANTYRQLIQKLHLAGYIRMQYSDYANPATTAVNTWATMFDLFNINPPGKFESTVGGLKMHHIQILAMNDVTPLVQLGGPFATNLRGPTPRNLVLPVAAALNPAPVIPGAMLGMPFQLPHHTLPSAAATLAANWRM